MKKLLLLFALVAVIIIFEECQKGNPCGDPPPYYIPTRLKVFHRTINLRSNLPNRRESKAITINNEEGYDIICNFDVYYTSSTKSGISSMFFNSAYATEPCEVAAGYKGAKYQITDIRITSTADYDSVHTKGKILNSIFRTFNTLATNDSLLASHIEHDNSFAVIPVTKPTLDSIHIFKVEITLSNGIKFSGETPPATFKKR